MENTTVDFEKILTTIKPKEIHVGMIADDVLELHPKDTMVAEPEVIGRDDIGLIVQWYYEDFELRLERVINDQFPLGVYAVQEIIRYEKQEDNSPSDD